MRLTEVRDERPESWVLVENLTPMASHVRARFAYNLWHPKLRIAYSLRKGQLNHIAPSDSVAIIPYCIG
jgi:hypothetical protein